MDDFEPVITLPNGSTVLHCFYDSIRRMQSEGRTVRIVDDHVVVEPFEGACSLDWLTAMSYEIDQIRAILAADSTCH